ncbi:hypothetical protein [Actinoplanes sp. NPDC026623]|uniref:hypothetical protein n=1 Tax=Actinoplanes sp. NPDC026623 TaxID=3155610 RepID=UPI0033E3DF96
MLSPSMIVASLRTAGIEMVDFDWSAVTLPASAAWMLFACSHEDGREDAVFVFDDPALVESANAAWWTLAKTGGLLTGVSEFLVSVGPVDAEIPARPHWARVRLMKDWNVIGAGTDHGVLGGPPGRPGFVMMSLDERVIVGATTGDGFISVVRVSDPAGAAPIRRAMGPGERPGHVPDV